MRKHHNQLDKQIGSWFELCRTAESVAG